MTSRARSNGRQQRLPPLRPQELDLAESPYEYPASYEQSEPLTRPHTFAFLLCVLFGIGYVIVYSQEPDLVADPDRTLRWYVLHCTAAALVYSSRPWHMLYTRNRS